MTNDKQRERLVELLGEKYNCVDRNRCLNEQADYLLADGWMRPPCKTGDILWYLDYGLPKCFICPEKMVVRSVYIINGKIFIENNQIRALNADEIGKTVFLTRDEAEQALVTDNNVGSKKEGGAE